MKSIPYFVVVALLSLCVWGAIRFVKNVTFNQECGGYLSRAANANTVDMAQVELKRAVDYLERHGMTSGYTSVLWRTPDEDIGFWYTNLKESWKELGTIAPDATPLERSNVLMKLRETLMHSTENSSSVTVPQGISVYPSNAAFFWWACASLGVLGFCVVRIIWEDV